MIWEVALSGPRLIHPKHRRLMGCCREELRHVRSGRSGQSCTPTHDSHCQQVPSLWLDPWTRSSTEQSHRSELKRLRLWNDSTDSGQLVLHQEFYHQWLFEAVFYINYSSWGHNPFSVLDVEKSIQSNQKISLTNCFRILDFSAVIAWKSSPGMKDRHRGRPSAEVGFSRLLPQNTWQSEAANVLVDSALVLKNEVNSYSHTCCRAIPESQLPTLEYKHIDPLVLHIIILLPLVLALRYPSTQGSTI
jgi:hypothetical protein